MFKRSLPLFLLWVFCLFCASAQASTLSFSARLVNADGSPAAGPVDLRFELAYSDDTSIIQCSKELDGVGLSSGVFHANLNFASTDCFGNELVEVLEAVPVSESVMMRVSDRTDTGNIKTYPFQALNSVPMSVMSELSSMLVQMGASDGEVLKWDGSKWSPASDDGEDGTVTQIQTNEGLTGGPITGSGTIGIADNGVTSAKIDDGTIQNADIGDGQIQYIKLNINDNDIPNSKIDGLGSAALADIGMNSGMVMRPDDVPNCLSSQKLQMSVGPTYFWSCVDDSTATDDTKLPLAGGTMEGGINMDGNVIENLPAPNLDGDAATKKYVDDGLAGIDESKWDESGSDIYYSSGNVGVGTITPQRDLHIHDTGVSSVMLTNDNSGQTTSDGIFLGLASNGTTFSIDNYEVGSIRFGTASVAGTPSQRMIIDSSGNVGIGATSSGAKLEVAGQVKITGGAPAAGKVLSSDASGLASWVDLPSSNTPSGSAGGELDGSYPDPLIADGVIDDANVMTGADINASKLGTGVVNNTEFNYLDGVTSPLQTQIDDKADASSLADYVLKAGDTMTGALNLPSNGLNVGTGELVVSGGNVGIGTTAPDYKLQIAEVSETGDFFGIGGPGNAGNFIIGGNIDNGGSGQSWIKFGDAGASANSGNGTVLQTEGIGGFGISTGGNERVRISNTGNVGIGTSSPLTTLHLSDFTTNNGGPILSLTNEDTTIGNTDQMMGRIDFNSSDPDNLGTVAQIVSSARNNSNGSIEFKVGQDGTMIDAMKIAGNGNVGIGTSPAEPLHISGGATSTVVRVDSSTTNAYLKFNTTSASSATIGSENGRLKFVPNPGAGEAFTVGSSGNVGVGTTSPSTKLEVAGQVKITGGTPGSGKVLSSDADGLASWVDLPSSNTPSGSAGGELDGTYPNPLIADGVIDDANVMAGADINASKLGTGVVNNTEFNYLDGVTSPIQTQIDDKADASSLADYVLKSGDTMTGALNLPSNGLNVGTDELVVSGGNVGIGTTNPTSPLKVNGKIAVGREGIAGTYNSSQVQGIWSIGEAYDIDLTNNNFGNQYGLVYAHTNSGSGVSGWGHQIMGVTNGTMTSSTSLNSGNAYFAGNVGIGTTSPSQELQVNGTILATDYLHNSDRRLKKNIENVLGLDLIMALKGVKYDWKKTGDTEYGFIAQEVEEVMPEVVFTDPITGLKSVRYTSIIAPLVASTQELNNKVNSLKQELEKRDEMIERQNKIMRDMESRLERLEKNLSR